MHLLSQMNNLFKYSDTVCTEGFKNFKSKKYTVRLWHYHVSMILSIHATVMMPS